MENLIPHRYLLITFPLRWWIEYVALLPPYPPTKRFCICIKFNMTLSHKRLEYVHCCLSGSDALLYLLFYDKSILIYFRLKSNELSVCTHIIKEINHDSASDASDAASDHQICIADLLCVRISANEHHRRTDKSVQAEMVRNGRMRPDCLRCDNYPITYI